MKRAILLPRICPRATMNSLHETAKQKRKYLAITVPQGLNLGLSGSNPAQKWAPRMKSGMISTVLFQMRFAFRWDITSFAQCRIPYSLTVYLFWSHVIIFISSMIELFQFGSWSEFCWFLGIPFVYTTNVLLVTLSHFRTLNIALAKPVTTPARIFKDLQQQEKRLSNPECWNALLCKGHGFWSFLV